MMRKLVFLCLVAIWMPLTLQAQIEQNMNEFENFVKQQQKEFGDFVDEQNKEFATFLKENWVEYQLEKPVERPQRPEPVKPTVFDKKKPVEKPKELKVSGVTKLNIPEVTPSATFPSIYKKNPTVEKKNPTIAGGTAKPYVKPKETPIRPVEKPTPTPTPTQPRTTRTGMEFDFYGETCVVNSTLKNKLRLKGVQEKDVASGWEVLFQINYQPLIDDCLATKKGKNLNDYGYLLLTKKVATELCGAGSTNEISLMQMFILCQSGYKVKVVLVNNRLELFFASKDLIYSNSFLTLDNTKYYRLGGSIDNSASVFTYQREFANSKSLIAMALSAEQRFDGVTKSSTLQSKEYPSVKVNSKVKTGLISFYKDYPQCDFSVYVGAPVSEEVKASLLPPLEMAIQGKKQSEAANILINFVQTAFQYETDGKQFGYEKPFFVDEIFYYPYSDCEDRAILFSYLVRTLLKLDVVLLDYPNHIATAVCFDENVSGDYLMVDGKKYTVCDPTFVGATIGNTMTAFKNTAAKVLKY